MKFADLNRVINEVEDYPHENQGVQPVADPIGYLSTPGAIVYLYVDGERHDSDSKIDEIVAAYKADHPETEFVPRVISKTDLHARRYFTFPRTEQLFVKKGYAAEFDTRKGPKGRGSTAYLNEQKSVIHVQTLLMAEVVRIAGPECFGWREDFIQSQTPKGQRAKYMLNRLLDQLAPITGVTSVERTDDPVRFAMVDRGGLRLGTAEMTVDDHAHLAFSGTPKSWLRSANQALSAGYLGGRRGDDIRLQIECEMSEPGLLAFFGRGLWRDHTGSVSALAMATSLSQTIASLRKLLWRANAEESQTYLENELMKERGALHAQGLRRNPTGARRLPLGDAEAMFRGVFAEEIENFADGNFGIAGTMLEDNVAITLTERDIVVGALCGSNIDLLNYGERPDPIMELCWWVAHLRKTGAATINGSFADLLDEVSHDPRDELTDLVYAAFSEEVWQCIIDAADAVARTSDTISASYNWGTVEAPWSARRQENELFLTGPLLYFPITEIAVWEKLGKVIADNGGFEVLPA